jgi:hypothetical protein
LDQFVPLAQCHVAEVAVWAEQQSHHPCSMFPLLVTEPEHMKKMETLDQQC